MTRNEEILLENRIARGLSTDAFTPAWRELATDENPHAFDWQQWQRRLVVLLLALLMDAAQELAAENELDASLVLTLYEQDAMARLAGIGATTERNILAEFARYQRGEITRDEYLTRAHAWFSAERAAGIADYELGKLAASATKEHMRALNVFQWKWIHFGGDEPCAAFCRDNVGRVFSLNEPMPPVHVKCHCRGIPHRSQDG